MPPHVRIDRYALTAAHNLDTGELYDLERDHGEVTNRRDAKAEMLARLCARMAGTIDPLPPVAGGMLMNHLISEDFSCN